MSRIVFEAAGDLNYFIHFLEICKYFSLSNQIVAKNCHFVDIIMLGDKFYQE